MYDQGGQAANGGVKYCNGGAKDMYFGGGVMALMPGGLIDTGTRDEGLMKDKISEVTNLGNGGVNKYATGGYNPRAMGNPIVGPNMMRLVDTMGGVDGILAMSNPNYSNPNNPNNPNNFGEDVGEVYPEGAFKGVSAPTPVSDVNNLTGSNAPQQSLATDPMTSMPTMETIPTMDSYQLPTQPTPEMPTADASYDVSSADISGGAGGGAGGGSPMGMITKGLGMASDVIQTLNPETKGGSDWLIAEKGNTRQKSIAPKYAWSTSGEMMGAAMNGMSQGAQMGSMAGPYGAAIGAAAGMVISPLMKGLADQKANEQLQNQFKGAIIAQNAEERRDEQWDAIGRDVDSTELIDKDRYAGLNGLGSTGNKFAKQGGALPKNKGVYGYYADGGGFDGGNPTTGAELVEQMRFKRGVDTLDSGITYQDLQGARSHPVYDDMGNEIQGRRNIGASSLSPGFDIRTNTYQPSVGTNIPQSRVAASPQLNNTMRMQEMPARPLARQSAPQYYAPTAQDPCGNYGLNQNVNQGFNLYNEPLKYAQKGNYYNPESLQKNEFVGPPEFSGEALVGGNYNNPDIRPTSTLINNETGEGYNFKNGGGKEKEESYDAMKDPVQWDIMQNYIASNDTRDRMSQAAVGSGDEMYAPYRVDNTCVAGVNCFEDLAGIPKSEGIPDDIYNNRLLKDFFESEEGKKYFRKLSGLESFFGGEKPGDYVQFENTLDLRGINRPSHIGLTTGKNRYLGDGNEDKSLYYNKIRKDPNVQIAGMEFTNVNPYFYRMLDKENRQKILEAALQAQEQGKDVIRPTLGQEATGYLPLQQYRKNTSYPIAGF
jgi:hypothetical protein